MPLSRLEEVSHHSIGVIVCLNAKNAEEEN
jgi:hypothetical protein